MQIQIKTQKEYQILSQLGQGLSSDVYKGVRRDLESNFQQIVTIKVYKSENFRKKFHTELENLSRIHCDGIPRVLDWNFDGSKPTIVTEYIDGCDLEQFIQAMQSRKVHISESLKMYIVDSIYQSLMVLHESGISHGDLKPSNILLSVEGKVKLIDICLGDHGLIYSTPQFSAPEVLTGNRPDAKSDLYSLGLIAHELEIKGFEDLLHMKPGFRTFKKQKLFKIESLEQELAKCARDVKYGVKPSGLKDSVGVAPKKVSKSRRAIATVDISRATQEVSAFSKEYSHLDLSKGDWKKAGLKRIKLAACGLCFLSMFASHSALTNPSFATIQFRSLKALEVWDQDRWNSLPYNFSTSVLQAQKLSFAFRSSEKTETIIIEAEPYEQKIIEIDAL